jgi:hypothetical protein
MSDSLIFRQQEVDCGDLTSNKLQNCDSKQRDAAETDIASTSQVRCFSAKKRCLIAFIKIFVSLPQVAHSRDVDKNTHISICINAHAAVAN